MTQHYYETMYILRPDIPEEEVEGHLSKYRDLVIESGGEVLDSQMRGKRRLAYRSTSTAKAYTFSSITMAMVSRWARWRGPCGSRKM